MSIMSMILVDIARNLPYTLLRALLGPFLKAR
jgi:hypothetical protein